MLWFTKVETTEVVIQPTPLELYEENLAELRTLNQQLAAAEKRLSP